MTEKDEKKEAPELSSRMRGELEEAQRRGIPLGAQVPMDTIVVKTYDSWVLYFSVRERAFFIKTLDYHPNPLKLPLADLNAMMADIEKIIEEENSKKGD